MSDYNIKIRVVSQTGHCGAGHKVGDEWLTTTKTPEGICISAFHSMINEIRVLRYGGTFPWEVDKDVTTVACNDPKNPVVFELRRVKK